jgi:hypothetical protein
LRTGADLEVVRFQRQRRLERLDGAEPVLDADGGFGLAPQRSDLGIGLRRVVGGAGSPSSGTRLRTSFSMPWS